MTPIRNLQEALAEVCDLHEAGYVDVLVRIQPKHKISIVKVQDLMQQFMADNIVPLMESRLREIQDQTQKSIKAAIADSVDANINQVLLSLDMGIVGRYSNLRHPLSFLSSRLSQFTKATRIFTTRDYTHTNVAAEFHQACDNIPNTLVIIKSGQYIAGGYTEVAWKASKVIETEHDPNSFLFSVDNQKIYVSSSKSSVLTSFFKKKQFEITRFELFGPTFNNSLEKLNYALSISENYASEDNSSNLDGGIFVACSETQGLFKDRTELFGKKNFTIDEYEVYKLE